MENVFLSGGLAFLITFFSIPVIIELAIQKKLYDEPNGRKVHKKVIPTLGGLGIFAGLMIATLIGTPVDSAGVLQYFIAAALILFFLGIKDDILILSASKKFLGQLFAAGVIIKFGGVQLQNMYGFMGIHELTPTAGLLLTLFTIIVITNSFNLIDGVDGLAGSLGVLTSFTFGMYFYQTGQVLYAVMAMSLVGALLAFLIYNFSPAKIFMGDTGSLLLGFMNSIFVIRFITTAADPASAYPIASAPAIGFAILIVPLFDTLRVVAIRVFNRRSPFSPDRNHIHHLLLDLGFKHAAVVAFCVLGNIGLIALAYALRFSGPTIVMAAVLSTSLAAIGIIYFSKSRMHIVPRKPVLVEESAIKKEHKVITLNGKKAGQESNAI
ncbi:MAG: undecaprenyl/decaprenyl-phosphate alpha-N-acetylglucosaminyl 1-phosphate transferase [Chitinophagaceae bacterium]|nr:undecaprenyl/decaprenyl-phosphate alpha-N-acetylglucosaminyl 1-phosphate transferase [Chitinophagaceae bacterium]